jgi:6-phosphofructokinase 1
VTAATMGGYAIDLLYRGETNRVICVNGGKYVDFDIDEALAMEKTIDGYQFLLSRLMSMY